MPLSHVGELRSEVDAYAPWQPCHQVSSSKATTRAKASSSNPRAPLSTCPVRSTTATG